MKQIFKSKLCMFSAILLSSCAHVSKADNIQALENGTMAAIVSGCAYDYKTNFFVDVDAKQSCTATWENENGEKISISGYNDIQFVKPGIYEFVGYKSKYGNRSAYTKYPGALSIFSTVDLKPGEVKYIGILNVNSRKSSYVLEAMSFSLNVESAKSYLNEKYPSLVNKMDSSVVIFTPEAIKVKQLFQKQLKQTNN